MVASILRWDLRHQLMIIPPATFGNQHRSVYSLEVSEPGEVTTTLDSLDNTVIDVRIPLVERSIDFDAWVCGARPERGILSTEMDRLDRLAV